MSNTQVSGSLVQAFLNCETTLQTLQREQTKVEQVPRSQNHPGRRCAISFLWLSNKLSQHLWLKAIAIYSLTVLQIRKQAETSWSCMKIKVLAGPQSLREALKRSHPLASSIDRCWCSWLVTPPLHCCLWGDTSSPLVPEISSAYLALQGHCDDMYFQLPGSRMISPSRIFLIFLFGCSEPSLLHAGFL